ncbi:MAG TPA: twin-arginine translocase TatA/TatE family subunit [Novosphingobium sp.]|nr:twin-arginine translocase TatA/TatE family subunit [Novosphingobium sp.]HZV11192.1 twin-arginine translocase TatA/TatE family subunit [Novosphingobium sp.]
MGLSLPHLIVLAVVVLVLFGRGRISEMMGDFGKGIKSFKEGMADETTNRPVTPPPAQIAAQNAPAPGVAPQAAATPATPAEPGQPGQG